MPRHQRDPWELAQDSIPPWRAEIVRRATHLGHPPQRDARWAMYAIQRFLEILSQDPICRQIASVGITGALSNGIWLEQVELACILIEPIARHQTGPIAQELTVILARVEHECAVPIVLVLLAASEIVTGKESTRWLGLHADYLAIWP